MLNNNYWNHNSSYTTINQYPKNRMHIKISKFQYQICKSDHHKTKKGLFLGLPNDINGICPKQQSPKSIRSSLESIPSLMGDCSVRQSKIGICERRGKGSRNLHPGGIPLKPMYRSTLLFYARGAKLVPVEIRLISSILFLAQPR